MHVCRLDALLPCKIEKLKRIINVLITKRRSIAPKSNDNYLVHPNSAPFAIFYYYFLEKNTVSIISLEAALMARAESIM